MKFVHIDSVNSIVYVLRLPNQRNIFDIKVEWKVSFYIVDLTILNIMQKVFFCKIICGMNLTPTTDMH